MIARLREALEILAEAAGVDLDHPGDREAWERVQAIVDELEAAQR